MKPERKHSKAQSPLAGDCQYGPEERSHLVHGLIHRSKLLSEQPLNTSVIITTEERGGQWGAESERHSSPALQPQPFHIYQLGNGPGVRESLAGKALASKA